MTGSATAGPSRRLRRSVASAAVAVAALASSSAPAAVPTAGQRATAGTCPAGERVRHPVPPGAWMTIDGAEQKLAFGPACWFKCDRTRCTGACVTPVPPSLRTDVPRLGVRPGETVVFTLSFRPRQLTLILQRGALIEMVPLPASRLAAWTVPNAFAASEPALALLEARAARPAPGRDGGDVVYLAWIEARGASG